VRRRIGVVIGLDLDDAAADAVEQKGRADQIGRHRVHAARKETPPNASHSGFVMVKKIEAPAIDGAATRRRL
jgi:hypothetical protein